MAKKVDYAQQDTEILARLNIYDEYRILGVEFAGEPKNGKCECRAAGRDDLKPSAVVFEHNGRYLDSKTGQALSLWQFAATFGSPIGFKDWKEARKHYADKAGVKLTGGNPKKDPLESIEFIPWDAGHERLADIWCRHHKKGITLEAIKLAGGRVGRYRRRYDEKKKEWQSGKFKVIALPCYGSHLLNADPVAWVIWNISGGMLEVWQGKGKPPGYAKMLSIGPTAGTMMGLNGLARLADPGDVPIEWVIKTGGPTDMLAALSVLPQDLRDSRIILTNASGEVGDILPHQAAIFAGLKAVVVHDCDEAGEVGAAKWVAALVQVAAEVKHVRLPWKVEKKGGKDLRDFFRGEPVVAEAELSVDEEAVSH